jgi:hypothetical protein
MKNGNNLLTVISVGFGTFFFHIEVQLDRLTEVTAYHDVVHVLTSILLGKLNNEPDRS